MPSKWFLCGPVLLQWFVIEQYTLDNYKLFCKETLVNMQNSETRDLGSDELKGVARLFKMMGCRWGGGGSGAGEGGGVRLSRTQNGSSL